MDTHLRELERKAISGDSAAKHRLILKHIRLGILKPIDIDWARYKESSQLHYLEWFGFRAGKYKKRLTPRQHSIKRKRSRKKRSKPVSDST